MSGEAPRPLLVRSFMTQTMADADILAVETGRQAELRRLLDAVRRSRAATPGSLQHVVLYGSRGFGKSFMARRVEIALAAGEAGQGIIMILLPEEQHNLQRNPEALLDMIALKLDERGAQDDLAFAEAHFQWPKPGEAGRRWDAAAARLESALDTALPGGRGLVVVGIENFDTLLATLFKDPEDEQRLRAWLDRRGNRIMIFATATGTVDLDYERPLFQAFEPVRLLPWSQEDCIAYFNRQRGSQGRPPLAAEAVAKARAIADFIGGTPRLAQLLGEVIDTGDALSVADTMAALAERLAEYYRRRIEDLAPLGRGLLDAIIRGGEPVSQTDLAARVGAEGQNRIARSMDDLQRADILRGRPAPESRETLYSVTDRVFVHYYRLRQGSRTALATPLATILDFLKSFYSRDEQRAQSLAYLEAGRPAEATLFSRIALEGVAAQDSFYSRGFADRLEHYLDAAPEALGADAATLAADLATDPAGVYERFRTKNAASPAAHAILIVIQAQALYRLGHQQEARAVLEREESAAVEASAKVILGIELSRFLEVVAKKPLGAAEIGLALERHLVDLPSKLLIVRGLTTIAWSLNVLERYEAATDIAGRAAALAREAEDKAEEARSLRRMAFSLGRLDRYAEAVETAGRAAGLAREAGYKAGEAAALRLMAFALGRLDRHAKAIETAGRAAALARETGNKAGEAESLRLMAFSLVNLDRHAEAIETAGRAAALAHETGDKAGEAESLRLMAFSLGRLDRHAEAVETFGRAAALARDVGDKTEEARSLSHMAFSLGRLDRHAESWAAAREAAALARAADDGHALTWAATVAITAARHGPRLEALPVYAEWVAIWRQTPDDQTLADPRLWLNDLFIAAARAQAFAELDAMLEEQGDGLVSDFASDASDARFSFFNEDGAVLARLAEAEGRAAAYAAMAGLLPRIAAVMARLPEARRDADWLAKLMSGFATACRDPGLLRDVAGLFTEALEPGAADRATLLRALATVDEAPEPERLLSRMDPDLATALRRLRGLPDPPPVAPKRRAGRRRKLPV